MAGLNERSQVETGRSLGISKLAAQVAVTVAAQVAVTIAAHVEVAVAAQAAVAVAALFLNIHLCTISCQDKFITFPNDLGQVTFVYFMCGATIQERIKNWF